MSFCLNKGFKIFAAGALTLNSVSSFTASCNPIWFKTVSTNSVDLLGPGKFYYGKFYKLVIANPGVALNLYITSRDGLCKYPDFIEFYNENTSNKMKTSGKLAPDGFYSIEKCNVNNFNIEKEFGKSEKNRNIKKPSDLENKLSNEDFYNICKKISYSIR